MFHSIRHFSLEVKMKLIAAYAVAGLSILFLCIVLQPYSLEIQFWGLVSVFGIGGVTALVTDMWLRRG